MKLLSKLLTLVSCVLLPPLILWARDSNSMPEVTNPTFNRSKPRVSHFESGQK